MKKQLFATLFAAGMVVSAIAPTAADAALLTDITVFSSNSDGHNYQGLIWNTQGNDTDAGGGFGKWNLYISPDPISDTSPTFVNSYNDSRTRVSLNLAPGVHTFSIYGNGVWPVPDPANLHFVLDLYFDGVQGAPRISGVQNLNNTNLQPAGSPLGFGVFGELQAGANTLSANVGNELVTLTSFSWFTDGGRDVVFPYHANDPPYSNGGEGPDYYGSFSLTVETVPEPGTLALLGLGLAGLAVTRNRRTKRELPTPAWRA